MRLGLNVGYWGLGLTNEDQLGLVLEAGAMAEAGETFILDMGQPVRIVSLVLAYAAHLGIADPEIRFTGLRPGEKTGVTPCKDPDLPVENPVVYFPSHGFDPMIQIARS